MITPPTSRTGVTGVSTGGACTGDPRATACRLRPSRLNSTHVRRGQPQFGVRPGQAVRRGRETSSAFDPRVVGRQGACDRRGCLPVAGGATVCHGRGMPGRGRHRHVLRPPRAGATRPRSNGCEPRWIPWTCRRPGTTTISDERRSGSGTPHPGEASLPDRATSYSVAPHVAGRGVLGGRSADQPASQLSPAAEAFPFMAVPARWRFGVVAGQHVATNEASM